jgi:hypothetical protein
MIAACRIRSDYISHHKAAPTKPKPHPYFQPKNKVLNSCKLVAIYGRLHGRLLPQRYCRFLSSARNIRISYLNGCESFGYTLAGVDGRNEIRAQLGDIGHCSGRNFDPEIGSCPSELYSPSNARHAVQDDFHIVGRTRKS